MFGPIISAAAAIGGGIISIFNKKTPDASELNQQEADLAKAQIGVNNTEASNPNLFVSGWRPYVGWVCGFAFTYDAFIRKVMSDILFMMDGSVLPPIDTTDVVTILTSMLGVIIYRTYEKKQGLTR